jgi:cyclopropane-fatty-acyl-phospholipid synthase
VLEIGCGWGALAEMAWGVRRLAGWRDLSTRQLAWASRRMAKQGVADKADHYVSGLPRDISKPPDAIRRCSEMMIRAVGRQFWRVFQTWRAYSNQVATPAFKAS